MLGENAKLKAQMNQLEDQVDSLEAETVRLRKALKNQVGAIGEQGFKFQGMTADMLMKVNEFAVNLRDGNIELPVDDRSSSLLKENKRLRDDIKSLDLKIDRYEREYGVKSSDSPAMSQQSASMRTQVSEIFGLREDLQRMSKENIETKQKMASMQDEVILLLKQHIGTSEGHVENVHSTVAENTEKLLRELQELREGGHTLVLQHPPTFGRSITTAGLTPRQRPGVAGAAVPRHPGSQFSATPSTHPVASSSLPSTPLVGGGVGVVGPGPSSYTQRDRSDSASSDPRIPHHALSHASSFKPMTPHGKQLLTKVISFLFTHVISMS